MAKVVGVGATPYSKNSAMTLAGLASRAVKAAVADAGLNLEDVDGIGSFQLHDSVMSEVVVTTLDLTGLTWTMDWLGGGNLPCALVGEAADAVDAGRAEIVVLYRAMNGRSGRRLGGTGQRPTFPGVDQFYGPPGVVSYAQKMALWAQHYKAHFGLSDDVFGPIATTFREHALKNPRAMMTKPMGHQEYLDSRWIVDPFRLPDICLESDGAVAVVVASDAVAASTRKPVDILSYAVAMENGAGLDLSDLLTWDDLTSNYAGRLRDPLLGRAQLDLSDIDVAEIYDCFTYTVCMSMEGLGFTEPGQTGAWFAAGGGDGVGGPAVNTHGGLLSEAYIHGMNHILEAVEQVRGESQGWQVPDARTALITSGAMTAGSAMILARS